MATSAFYLILKPHRDEWPVTESSFKLKFIRSYLDVILILYLLLWSVFSITNQNTVNMEPGSAEYWAGTQHIFARGPLVGSTGPGSCASNAV